MPRNKAPFPPIIALTALCDLYRRKRFIPEYPNQIAEKPYTDALTAALIKDKVIDGKSSRNFVSKLRGAPSQAEADETEGIDTSMLDKIVRIVIKEYGLENYIPEERMKFPWVAFCEELFPTPYHLQGLDEARKYYKFLTNQEKADVDGYLMRLINEFDIASEDIFTYCAYMWSPRENKTSVGIFQINRSTNVATYSYYVKNADKWVTRTALRSNRTGGNYFIGNNTLYITLVEEDSSKIFAQMNVVLAIQDIDFLNQRVLKGVISSSAGNASIPMCAKIIMEKKKSFRSALAVVKGELAKNPVYCFEVMNNRIEVLVRLREEEDHYNQLFKVIQDIKGHYIYAYVAATDVKNSQHEVSIAICSIEDDGRIRMDTPNDTNILAYVDSMHYQGIDHFTIKYFSHIEGKGFDFFNVVKIIRNWPNPKAISLDGKFMGLYRSIALYGDILFVRIENVESHEQLWQKYQPVVIKKEDIVKQNDLIKKLCEDIIGRGVMPIPS